MRHYSLSVKKQQAFVLVSVNVILNVLVFSSTARSGADESVWNTGINPVFEDS